MYKVISKYFDLFTIFLFHSIACCVYLFILEIRYLPHNLWWHVCIVYRCSCSLSSLDTFFPLPYLLLRSCVRLLLPVHHLLYLPYIPYALAHLFLICTFYKYSYFIYVLVLSHTCTVFNNLFNTESVFLYVVHLCPFYIA